jgi:hypothetical protein
MTQPYAAVQVCERAEAALDEEDLGTLRRRLRELADLLESDVLDDPAFDAVRDRARELAGRADEVGRTADDIDIDGVAALPADFEEEVATLTHRVCRCYLRVAEIDPDALPDLDQDPDDVTAAVEAIAQQQSELETQTVLWAARAKSMAAERDAAAEALEEVLEAVSELDTDRSRLEASREARDDLVEREREARKRRERIEERARNLGTEREDDGEE